LLGGAKTSTTEEQGCGKLPLVILRKCKHMHLAAPRGLQVYYSPSEPKQQDEAAAAAAFREYKMQVSIASACGRCELCFARGFGCMPHASRLISDSYLQPLSLAALANQGSKSHTAP
jgi:hypothetical protein